MVDDVRRAMLVRGDQRQYLPQSDTCIHQPVDEGNRTIEVPDGADAQRAHRLEHTRPAVARRDPPAVANLSHPRREVLAECLDQLLSAQVAGYGIEIALKFIGKINAAQRANLTDSACCKPNVLERLEAGHLIKEPCTAGEHREQATVDLQPLPSLVGVWLCACVLGVPVVKPSELTDHLAVGVPSGGGIGEEHITQGLELLACRIPEGLQRRSKRSTPSLVPPTSMIDTTSTVLEPAANAVRAAPAASLPDSADGLRWIP